MTPENRLPAGETRIDRAPSNFLLLWLRDGLYCLASTLSSASVLQAFFLKMGMASGTVSYYASFTQAVFLVFSLLFAGAADRCVRTKRAATLLFFANAASLLFQMTLCLLPAYSAPFCIAAFAAGALVNVTNTVRVVFEYKMICEVIPVGRYSLYSSVSGIVYGVAGILPGILLPVFYARYDYTAVTLAVFCASGLFCMAAGALNGCLRLLPGKEEELPEEALKKNVSSVREVLERSDFRRLALPNFIRGFGAGVVAILPLLAIKDAGLPEEKSALIAGVMNAATFLSCGFYGILRQRKIKATTLGVAGSCLFFTLCAAFLGSPVWFLAVLFFAYCGYNLVCYAIPDAVYQKVEEDVISAYHTWRMALTTLGTVLSTAVIGLVADSVSGTVLALVGTASIFFCCLAYHRVFRSPTQPE
ncbi:MAG: MFS transporter [Clostridiales bacterium]|nr:MFS transporter [Clostridiales bacterium]